MLIIQILKDIFKLFYCDTIVTESDILNVDNEIYKIDFNSRENKGYIGFFDWLRLDENKIVGIRTCYFEDLPYNKFLSTYKYVVSSHNGMCMEILFSNENYDVELSGDQDFTNNYVYSSNSGNYLLTFGLDHLENKELELLIKICKVLKASELTT